MFKVTFIGKDKLESRNVNQEELDKLSEHLKVELWELLKNLVPAFVVQEVK